MPIKYEKKQETKKQYTIQFKPSIKEKGNQLAEKLGISFQELLELHRSKKNFFAHMLYMKRSLQNQENPTRYFLGPTKHSVKLYNKGKFTMRI